MALDLAFLTLNRAPIRGRAFTALVILAMAADDRDQVSMTHGELAFLARITRARAQIILEQLEQDGYLHRYRWGKAKNPQQHYFLMLREKLMLLPERARRKAERRSRQFAGQPVRTIARRLDETIAARAQAAAAELREFYALGQGPQQVARLLNRDHNL